MVSAVAWLMMLMTDSLGEARAALKWADGKILKNEVDMQVRMHMFIILKLSSADFVLKRALFSVQGLASPGS